MSTYKLLDLLLPMVLLCLLLPKKLRPIILLGYSLFACISSGWQGVLYMTGTAAVTYMAATGIDRLQQHRKAIKKDKAKVNEKKAIDIHITWICYVALGWNFGLLALLKYVPSLPYHLLDMAGIKIDYFTLPVPLGVSFYTFALSGYLLDVKNRKIQAEHNFLKVMLFASYYPLLIQGPICRYGQLIPEMMEAHNTEGNFYRGGIRILWGVLKKIVVADRAALFVNDVFDPQSSYGGAIILLGVLFYSLMQYTDFSGGIDIVLGISEMMGIHPSENFRQPYFAASLGDFWRRWHITLGAWMRDYVFYPFALSRPVQFVTGFLKKRGMKHLSRTVPAAVGNILVFFLVGIWHGKTSNFIAWGLYNGIILAISALLEPVYARFRTDKFRRIRILRTFLIVNIGWFFDRCSSVGHALRMLRTVFVNQAFFQLTDGTILSIHLQGIDYIILTIAVMLIFCVSVQKENGKDVLMLLRSQHPVLQFVVIYMMFVCILVFAVRSDNTGFMYAMY